MVAFVSWPQFRPVHTASVWRYAGSGTQQTLADDAAQYSDKGVIRPTSLTTGQFPYGVNSNSADDQIGAGRRGDGLTKGAIPFYTPDAVAALGGKLNALTGLARTSLNAPIPYAKLLLRNIRTGQVMGRTTTNEQGQFSFLDLDSSSYVVELLGADGSVVAASPMVALALGDVRQTNVNAAASAASLTATFGNSLNSSMPQLTTVATNSDITRTTPALSSEITVGAGGR
jgi:hypothetical protein